MGPETKKVYRECAYSYKAHDFIFCGKEPEKYVSTYGLYLMSTLALGQLIYYAHVLPLQDLDKNLMLNQLALRFSLVDL